MLYSNSHVICCNTSNIICFSVLCIIELTSYHYSNDLETNIAWKQYVMWIYMCRKHGQSCKSNILYISPAAWWHVHRICCPWKFDFNTRYITGYAPIAPGSSISLNACDKFQPVNHSTQPVINASEHIARYQDNFGQSARGFIVVVGRRPWPTILQLHPKIVEIHL